MLNDPSTTVKQRIADFLVESDKLGVIWRKAAIVAAVSVNESAATFSMKRDDLLVYPPECYPSRQTLIIEEGNPSLGTRLRTSWTSDAEIMARLAEQGWLNPGAPDQLSKAFGVTDLIKTPNVLLASLFEWLIDRRKTAALGAFSVGPTQMYLRQSKMAGGLNGFTVPSFPDTIEDLWEFYTANTYATLWATGFWDYLSVTAASYPTPASSACGHANQSSCVEAYLQQFQTGTRNWASSDAGYAQSFSNNVRLVWSTAKETGYDNDPRNEVNVRRTAAVAPGGVVV
jgi:hypothetical protein